MTHLLVTNDYPPKVGGIQNYLWELWRRLPPDEFAVFTRPHPGDGAFDAGEGYRIVRSRQRFLLPTPSLRHDIDALVAEIGAGLVVFDPAFPAGAVGPSLSVPYSVILHGAEVTIPARLPGTDAVMARTVSQADLIVSASAYASGEAADAAGGLPPSVYVPPGVDVDRFRPLDAAGRDAARRRLGLPIDRFIVLGLSRLVRRKGYDVVIRAADRLARAVTTPIEVVIGGDGRDRRRLERVAREVEVPVRFLGTVADHDLADLYACADVFAMVCQQRWGGLEQEGFGIVFLEAAAAGTPQIAGRSGGSAEAVADGTSGLVVDDPADVHAVAGAMADLLTDPGRRAAMAEAGRRRCVEEFSYDLLSRRLLDALRAHDGTTPRSSRAGATP